MAKQEPDARTRVKLPTLPKYDWRRTEDMVTVTLKRTYTSKVFHTIMHHRDRARNGCLDSLEWLDNFCR